MFVWILILRFNFYYGLVLLSLEFLLLLLLFFWELEISLCFFESFSGFGIKFLRFCVEMKGY